MSGSDLEREGLYYEHSVGRKPYLTTQGLERDSFRRPLSPATGRVLDAGIDYPTPQLQEQLDEEAWRLEVEYNRAQKKKHKRGRR